MKLKVWDGMHIPETEISIKLDGIQAMLVNGEVVSRSKKKLYNVNPSLLEEGKKYEIYVESFSLTNSILRSHVHPRKITKDDLYEIYPTTDPRLVLPLTTDIKGLFDTVRGWGYEGLIIDRKFKVKDHETYDVEVIGIIPGKGKHSGKMGALLTPMGKVGTGFTDKDREYDWKLGELIEVECMELTDKGKFRHPRFIRLRWDK